MKPKDLIISNIESSLNEPLTRLGFTFSKSSLIFKRKATDFNQRIRLHLNRYNGEGLSAEFWTSFEVSSKLYSKWHLSEFGMDPPNDAVAGEMDWNIEGWEFPIINNKKESHFQIINEKERDNVLNVLKNDIFNIGIPYLDRLSNWENAAYELVDREWFHFKACDFFLIAGNREKALWALEQGLDLCKEKPNASSSEHKDEIAIRLKKYFGR